MLRYLGLGKRFFGDHPMPAHKRVNWEFLAIMSGKIAPFERDDAPCLPVGDRFWLFPPGVVHGWRSERGKTCEIIVIHFSTVPQALERIALRHGHLQMKLGLRDKVFLREIASKLKRHYWQPTLESEIHTERALMDLSLLILRDRKELRQRQNTGSSVNKVTTVVEWLREHLAENPSIAEAAQVVGLSTSQLNRLFCRIQKKSPQRVLNRLKIDRAMELLGSTNAKLHSVAGECGFSTASNLCRAFKALKGHSPSVWRQEMFIQYKPPSKFHKAEPYEHGRRLRPVL